MEETLRRACIERLKEELVPAMGCTEPIAVAYAAALAKKTLGKLPERAEIEVSGNILKNVKSVIVPHTGGLRGVESAAAAGFVAGDADRELEVLASVREEEYPRIAEYRSRTPLPVREAAAGCVFDIGIRAFCGSHTAFVRITGHHTNVVRLEKDENVLINRTESGEADPASDPLTVRAIVEFAKEDDLSEVKEALERQIEYNTAICDEGLRNDWGARVGKTLLNAFGDDIHNRAKAWAAAGSDARMNGCPLPVVVVSGSGNQGITASVPVIAYARHLNVPHEQLLRALAPLRPCDHPLEIGHRAAVGVLRRGERGRGAAAGICFLYGGGVDEISHTIVNAIAIDSGMVCDGAKSSCAAKIACAVESGLIGFELYRAGGQFYGGDGIVSKGVENTIRNVGELASRGMRETDEEIIRLMLQ